MLVSAQSPQADRAGWHAHALVEKWTEQQVAEVAAATGVATPSEDLPAVTIGLAEDTPEKQ
jgi:hypothetical protein